MTRDSAALGSAPSGSALPGRPLGGAPGHAAAAHPAAGQVRGRHHAPERRAADPGHVLPLLAMVGLTVTPLLDGIGASRINVAVPRHPRAVCHVHRLHRAGHLHRFRPPLRGAAFPLHHSPGPHRADRREDPRGPRGAGPDPGAGGHRRGPGARLAAGSAGVGPALALLVLGAAAFTALGLLVAGTVRPEATLAITNLLWILLGALGGIVIPAERLPARTRPEHRAVAALRRPGTGNAGRVPAWRHVNGCLCTCPADLDGACRRQQQPAGSNGIENNCEYGLPPSPSSSAAWHPSCPSLSIRPSAASPCCP
jgi:ABC-2 type transport system permease protein